VPPLSALPLLALAAFVAGLVDSIAGGGGLIVLPSLLAAGLPPHFALGTNKGQSLFGAVASAASFARRGYVDRARVIPGFALGFVGAIAGAFAQLAIRPDVLRPIVIALLLLAAGIVGWPRRTTGEARPIAHAKAIGAVVALVLGAYDGFFGPGVGTMLLVSAVLVYGDSLTHASGNAKVVNLASNVASFATFAFHGTILWSIALPMAACNALGAWIGARLAVKRGDKLVRVVVLAVVTALVAKIALDLRR